MGRCAFMVALAGTTRRWGPPPPSDDLSSAEARAHPAFHALLARLRHGASAFVEVLPERGLHPVVEGYLRERAAVLGVSLPHLLSHEFFCEPEARRLCAWVNDVFLPAAVGRLLPTVGPPPHTGRHGSTDLG
jgi:hypothetical protein